MSQLALLAGVAPRVPDWCNLRLGDVGAGLAELAAAGVRVDLVVADPPWQYDQRAGSASAAASDEYACLPMGVIRDHLKAAETMAAPGSRCLLWATWAKLPELTGYCARYSGSDRVDLACWRWVSGGTWAKSDPPDEEGNRQVAPGMGYHLRSSQSEPFIVLAGPGPHRRADVPGCWVAPGSGRHSEKPVDFQTLAVRGWCPPGGVVLDLYAGLGSVARAVARAGEGRRYIGFEVDAERHAAALSLLAQDRGGV